MWIQSSEFKLKGQAERTKQNHTTTTKKTRKGTKNLRLKMWA